MSTALSVGAYTKFAVAATGSSSWTRFPKTTCGLAKHSSIVIPDMTTGTRERPQEINREAPYTISGDIGFNCTPALLAYFLPYISGDTGSPWINTNPAGGLASTFKVAMNKQGQMHSWSGLVVDRAVFSFARGELVSCMLSIEGIDEAVGGSSDLSSSALNALSVSLSPPYIFHDAALTVGGTSYAFSNATLVIDNVTEKNQFYGGSRVRASLPWMDLRVGISLSMPYNTTNKALYDTDLSSAAVVMTCTNGSNVWASTLPAVQFPAQPIPDSARNEIIMPLEGVASSASGGNVYSISQS